MRARLEPTQLEHLSDASFLGKLLMFPANVRLGWKVIASTNTLAYLASSTATKEKMFYNIDPSSTHPWTQLAFSCPKFSGVSFINICTLVILSAEKIS